MKPRPGSTRDLSLARKRALIRSLVEQLASTSGATATPSAAPVAATSESAPVATIIQFPIPGK